MSVDDTTSDPLEVLRPKLQCHEGEIGLLVGVTPPLQVILWVVLAIVVFVGGFAWDPSWGVGVGVALAVVFMLFARIRRRRLYLSRAGVRWTQTRLFERSREGSVPWENVQEELVPRRIDRMNIGDEVVELSRLTATEQRAVFDLFNALQRSRGHHFRDLWENADRQGLQRWTENTFDGYRMDLSPAHRPLPTWLAIVYGLLAAMGTTLVVGGGMGLAPLAMAVLFALTTVFCTGSLLNAVRALEVVIEPRAVVVVMKRFRTTHQRIPIGQLRGVEVCGPNVEVRWEGGVVVLPLGQRSSSTRQEVEERVQRLIDQREEESAAEVPEALAQLGRSSQRVET